MRVIARIKENYRVDGLLWMSEELGISKPKMKRWNRTPAAAFINVGSSGCGFTGKAYWTMTFSLDGLPDLISAQTSLARQKAVQRRWDR